MKKNIIFSISIIIFLVGCIDDSPLTDASGNDMGIPKIASGPIDSNSFLYAGGIIDAAGETTGIFMENVSTTGTLGNAEKLVSGIDYMGDSYMALIQEDVFKYARDKYLSQFETDQATAEKKYLKIASQVKVLLALYNEDLHLLVSDGSGITDIAGLAGKNVNLGSLNSGTYITASIIIDAYENIDFSSTTFTYDDPVTGIEKVVCGVYDAAFYVTAVPSDTFTKIPEATAVDLIQVTMPEAKKLYSEDGAIKTSDYSFQDVDISNNIQVKTLLAGGPNFNDKSIQIFLNYIFDHSDEYKEFHTKWDELSRGESTEYMIQNPKLCNFKAISYITGYPDMDEDNIEPYFYSGENISSYHDMSIELIWLLSHNMDLDLRETNSTGAWENSYRLFNGSGTMGLVQDDIYSYLKQDEDVYSSMQAASLKKLAPLHYEYLHLVIKNGTGYTNVQSILNDTGVHINVGPKTSGTFMTAMEVIKSYTGTGDRTYHFDSDSDAVVKVASTDAADGLDSYDAAFVMSGVPYDRFYSHDTYVCENLTLISAQFNGAIPFPYREGQLAGDGAVGNGNYPYPVTILIHEDIPTVRARAILVVSPVFDDTGIEVFLKSIFRKTEYQVFPADPADADFMPNPLWITIQKESYTAPALPFTDNVPYYDTYEEDIVGAKEYFVRYPYGWSKEAVKYYLSMFSEN